MPARAARRVMVVANPAAGLRRGRDAGEAAASAARLAPFAAKADTLRAAAHFIAERTM